MQGRTNKIDWLGMGLPTIEDDLLREIRWKAHWFECIEREETMEGLGGSAGARVAWGFVICNWPLLKLHLTALEWRF